MDVEFIFRGMRKKNISSLPAKVNTRVAKRKTRRGPGPRGTRVGSICSRTAAPKATPASVARVPRLVTGRCTPLELALSFSISISLSPPGHPRDADALVLPRRSATMNRPTRRTTLVRSSPPVDAADTRLITYMPFLRLANNRILALAKAIEE